MNPYVAVIRPVEKSPRATARLVPAARTLAATLRAAMPAVKVTTNAHSGSLLLVTNGSREFTTEEQERCTSSLQAKCDRLFRPGTFKVSGYTRETLPTQLV